MIVADAGGTLTTTVLVTISLVPVVEDLLMVKLWNVEKLLANVEVKPGTVMLGVLLPVPPLLDVDEVFATGAELILVLSLFLLLLLPRARVPSTVPPMTAPSTTRMTTTVIIIPLRVLYQDRDRCGGRGYGDGPPSSFWRYPSDSLCM